MKENKFILATATALVLVSLGGAKAFAAEDGTGKIEDKTNTKVTIIDDKDPTDPDDNSGKKFSLEHVPTNFDFTSKLNNKKYSISSGAISDTTKNTNTIDVFNNKVKRNWEVKATIGDLTDSVTGAVIKNPSMTIASEKQGTATTGTGAPSIVFQNVDGTLDAANNTGLLKNKVTGITIDFLDQENELKANSVLTAEVTYNLASTKDAD